MVQENSQPERGQSIVIFAILMIVFLALAALVIDGGFSLAKRREAQNAADAGALAGAEALCGGGTQAEAQAQALDYAGRNGAINPVPVISFGSTGITVTATMPHQTFLASIIGSEVVSPTASASAGCFVPCNLKGVLPVAWLCEDLETGSQQACGIHYEDPNAQPTDPQLYVIMDQIKVEGDVCMDPPNSGTPVGALDCDLNNDGYNELKTGGGRSWLDLDGGGGGSNQLKQWVLGGYGGDLVEHTWFTGQSGTANDVFQAVATLWDQIVLLPVFDTYPCVGRPDINCPDLFHTKASGDLWDDQIVPCNGPNCPASQLFFHVVSFSAFHITCVEAPGVLNPYTHQKPDCPGKNAAIAANPSIPENTKSIEGYFVEYNAGEGRCTGPDVGVHTIYLNN